MKVSVMPWHVFWDAFEKQDPPPLDGWVQRWVFADDGISALVKSRGGKRMDSEQPVYVVPRAGPNSLLSEAPLAQVITQHQPSIQRAKGENGKIGIAFAGKTIRIQGTEVENEVSTVPEG
ncbi:MAG: hypothetical protein IH857_04780 [Deltaproteobacteria bacterium]|nr:hypothetical protein [Deltaproteobacteria bacterium]